ncbi:hypothetical protein ACH0BU_13720 [Sphingomonas olei]
MMQTAKDYLRRDEAARYLQRRYGAYTAQTLAKLACVGGGPIYRKVGRIALYQAHDLDTWMASRMSGPIENTAQLQAAR